MKLKEEPGGPVCMDKEITNDYKFLEFCFRARFYHDHNLKLAYLLIRVKNCSLVDAAAALGVSRTLFYTKIFPDNQAFLSRTVKIAGWGTGRSERRIKMSDETLTYTRQIQEFAEFSLGEVECQRLKTAANKIQTGETKRNTKYWARIKQLRNHENNVSRQPKRCKNYKGMVANCAKDFQTTKDKVLKDIAGGQG